jgi:hypothetical protein
MKNTKKYLIYIIAGIMLLALAVLASKMERISTGETRVPNTEIEQVVDEQPIRPYVPMTSASVEEDEYTLKPWRKYCY